MKTLDEVITDLKEELPKTCADALYYLKEYKKTKKHLACMDSGEIRGDDTQVVNNPPLTWKELTHMIGKPVWMERPEWKEWLLVSEVDMARDEIFLRDKWGNGVIVNGRNMGYWRAYREEYHENAR